MNESELTVQRKLPQTIKKLVQSGIIVKESMLTVIFHHEEIIDQFLVFWNSDHRCYTAQLVKLIGDPSLGHTQYGIFVRNNLLPQREDYLRRMVRTQLGITRVGGYGELEPKSIPHLAAAA